MRRNEKALSILLRSRMRPRNPISPTTIRSRINQTQFSPLDVGRIASSSKQDATSRSPADPERVRDSMHFATAMSKTESLDVALDDFSVGYLGLSEENRRALLLTLAREYDLNRAQVREMMKQYLGLELPSGDKTVDSAFEEEGSLSAFYRIERNLRHSLKPMYEVLFERLNTYPGGLRFLTIMRSDILDFLMEENFASLRALDSYLKEKLSTWLSPANLELHNITWDDPASLLEKIVVYEAVHPIRNLLDLKRRLGIGRRCFAYFHPSIPGEPLIFIEVALMKSVAGSIKEVLWDDPPIPESEANCAVFYSISSTQPGLSGINLGKFLIKRVIDVVRKVMPNITTFATLSPIPGFMQWLLPKLSSVRRPDSAFCENLLMPKEEKEILEAANELMKGQDGMEIMLTLLSSNDHAWTKSEKLSNAFRIPLMRLCARYLLKEKKRQKALDSVGNFHLQNGAMIGRINWMADQSVKGLKQSAGLMVNYIYMVENIEENAQAYFSSGKVQASPEVQSYLDEEHCEEIKE